MSRVIENSLKEYTIDRQGIDNLVKLYDNPLVLLDRPNIVQVQTNYLALIEEYSHDFPYLRHVQ